jgi:protein TonB
VPIAVDNEELPDDVTIETTELDVYEEPPPPPDLPPAPDEEVYEFYHVEIKPKLVKSVTPDYPEIARKASIEGTVFIKMMVGKSGKVESVEILKGPEIFHEAATNAAMQFEFTPAIQNDRPVKVWVGQGIVFRLKN